jgi:hypothetical protein
MSQKPASTAVADPAEVAKTLAHKKVQSAKDLVQLNIMLQAAGIPEAFEPLTKVFGVEFLNDVELLVDSDIEALTSLTIIKRRKLKIWVRSRRHVNLDTHPGVELVSVADKIKHMLVALFLSGSEDQPHFNNDNADYNSYERILSSRN